MGEIRLICPGCRVEYDLPRDAIPHAGREVECTACGRVWFASATGEAGLVLGDTAKQADPTPRPGPDHGTGNDTPAAPVSAPLSQRLPASVLNILRDEVEHERRARMAEDDAFGRMPPQQTADVDWPATTITDEAADLGTAGTEASAAPEGTSTDTPPATASGISPVVPAANAPRASLGDLQRTDQGGVAADQGSVQPTTDSAAAQTLQPAPAEPAVPHRILRPQGTDAPPTNQQQAPGRPSSYRVGMGVAAMTAAACLALYLLAPGLAGSGPIGETLIGLRESVDEGRIWLQSRVAGLPG